MCVIQSRTTRTPKYNEAMSIVSRMLCSLTPRHTKDCTRNEPFSHIIYEHHSCRAFRGVFRAVCRSVVARWLFFPAFLWDDHLQEHINTQPHRNIYLAVVCDHALYTQHHTASNRALFPSNNRRTVKGCVVYLLVLGSFDILTLRYCGWNVPASCFVYTKSITIYSTYRVFCAFVWCVRNCNVWMFSIIQCIRQ